MKTNKESLINGVLELLEEDPLGKISTKNIANKCNINEATIYRHFTNNKHLFNSVVEYVVEDIREVCLYNDETDCRTLVLSFLNYLDSNPSYAAVLNIGQLFNLRASKVVVNDLFLTLETIIEGLTGNTVFAELLVYNIKGRISTFVINDYKEPITDKNSIEVFFRQFELVEIRRPTI